MKAWADAAQVASDPKMTEAGYVRISASSEEQQPGSRDPSVGGTHNPLDQRFCHGLHDHERLAHLRRLTAVQLQLSPLDDARRLARRRHCLAFRGHVAALPQRIDLYALRASVRPFPGELPPAQPD